MGVGVYDYREVEDLLHISSSMLSRIALPGTGDGSPALVRPQHHWFFTFDEFVSVAVVVSMRVRGLPYSEIAAVQGRLGRDFETRLPFAHQDALRSIRFSGRDVLIFDGASISRPEGQLALMGVVELYLEQLQFGDDGVAVRWVPADGIVLDPDLQAGAPCLAGTRMPTATLSNLVRRGQSPEIVADDMNVTVEQVRLAVDFESRVEQTGLTQMAA